MEKSKGNIVLIGNHHIVIYNFRKELIQRLLELNYQVIVFLPYTKEADRISDLGCKLVDIPVDRRGMNPIRDYGLYRKYKKELRKWNPNIVLNYTVKPDIYGGMACRRLHIPYICTITGVGTSFQKKGPLRSLILAMYKVAMKNAKKVFFQNKSDCAIFEEENIAQKRYVLVNGSGVNLQHFSLRPFPEESEPFRVLFSARIARIKGVDLYLEAAEILKKRYPDMEFHMIGFWEEDFHERVRDMEKRGIVIYHGMQSDVRPFIEQCQCLVHPSRNEGMSNICLEAEAIGRAVIAANIPGCMECVEDGVTGFLHEPNHTEDLVNKIEKFKSLSYNDRKHMGELARVKVEREFGRELVVDAYMNEIM